MSILRVTLIFVALIATLFTANIRSEDIVRLQLDYAGKTVNIDLELFAGIAPLTVANYLDYVTSGSYDGTFVYRSLPGFVLQTGGYTFRPVVPASDPLRPVAEANGLEEVVPFSPVMNEFNLSNIRGTIALAKLDAQPNSGSNEWFINLADNSENLDNQNEGFTVFGSVIDNGMTFADEISAYPIHAFIKTLLGDAFDKMPVTGAVFGAILQQDMIMIRSASVINRPIVRFDPADGDYDLDIAGDMIDEILTVTLKNTGDEALTIGAINPADLSAPFSLTNDNCSSTTLSPQSAVPASVCTINFIFSPTAAGAFNDSIVIPYTSQATSDTFSVTYPLLGEGIPASPVLYSATTTVDFSESTINTNVDVTLTIRNKGGSALSITNLGISGTDASDFSIQPGGCTFNTNLAMGETCTITLRFLPVAIGIKSGVLNIVSAAGGSLSINLNGTGTKPVIDVASSINVVAQLNQTASAFEIITNSGDGNLILTNISISGTDASFFTQQNNCPDTNNMATPDAPLGAGEQCGLLIEYAPTVTGQHSATLTIDSNDPDTPSIDISLTGETGNPVIAVPSSLFIGTAQIAGLTTTGRLVISNNGVAPLEITTISGLTGGFSGTSNCTGTGVQITAGGTCVISITYAAATLGNANTVLTIESNDPANPMVTVSVGAFGDYDTDGITSLVENSAPNSGDGNNDGILDEIQNNVASFSTSNTKFLTLISDDSLILNQTTTLRDMVTETSGNIIVSGTTLAFDYDLHGFSVSVPNGDGVNIAIFLPVEARPDGYYKFGPTPDDTTPHWYNFNYDATTQTGASLIGKVSVRQPGGASAPIDRYMIIVSYIDGALGDDDLTVNGEIIQGKGGIVFNNLAISADSGSGSLSLIALLIISLSIFWLRILSNKGILLTVNL